MADTIPEDPSGRAWSQSSKYKEYKKYKNHIKNRTDFYQPDYKIVQAHRHCVTQPVTGIHFSMLDI